MKKGWLYIICRILNWVLPILMLINLESEISPFLELFGYYVLFMYVIYVCTHMFFAKRRSRWFYEIWIFVFAGAAVHALITNNLWIINLGVVGFGHSTDGIAITLNDKVICIAFCVLVMLSKIITLIYQTKEYRAGADERRENLLNEKIHGAEFKMEIAENTEELSSAKAKFERAIRKKERWEQTKD